VAGKGNHHNTPENENGLEAMRAIIPSPVSLLVLRRPGLSIPACGGYQSIWLKADDTLPFEDQSGLQENLIARQFEPTD
jgi:hypothetical protein